MEFGKSRYRGFDKAFQIPLVNGFNMAFQIPLVNVHNTNPLHLKTFLATFKKNIVKCFTRVVLQLFFGHQLLHQY